jgi:WD40 repeat protein
MTLRRLHFNRWLAIALGSSLVLNVALFAFCARLLRRPMELSARSPSTKKLEPTATRPVQEQPQSRGVTERLPKGIRAVLRGHRGRISAVTYTPDGSTLIVATDVGVLSLWDRRAGIFSLKAEHGPEILGLAGDRFDLRALAIAPDCRSLAYLCDSDSRARAPIRIFDIVSTRTRVIGFDLPDDGQDALHGLFSCLAFSPDGKTLAAGRRDGVVLFEVETGRYKGVLQKDKRFYYAKLAFSPGSPTSLAGKSFPWEVQIFDVASRGKLQDFKRPKTVTGVPVDRLGSDVVEDMVFSPDGARLAASTWENCVFLWDVRKGELVAAIQEGLGSGWTEGRCLVEFTADGEYLVTASRGLEDLVRINARKRSVTTGELVSQMELVQPGEPFPNIYPRAIAPDGRSLVGIGEFSGRFENSLRESLPVIYDIGPLFDTLVSTSP